MSADVVLSCNGLTAGYGRGASKKEVVKNVSLQLRRGEVVCLLGANGAGKSTLLRTLCGYQPPLGGTVEIGGTELSRLSPRDVAKMVSVVYTERGAVEGLSVEQTVALGRQPYTGWLGRLSAEDAEVVEASMRQMDVWDMRHRDLSTLSDGERQKVLLARAVAQSTPLLILDEPTSFLDAGARLEVMQLLSVLASEHAKSVILSTHDISAALTVATRLWLLGADGNLTCGEVSGLAVSEKMEALFPSPNIYFDERARDFRLKKTQR